MGNNNRTANETLLWKHTPNPSTRLGYRSRHYGDWRRRWFWHRGHCAIFNECYGDERHLQANTKIDIPSDFENVCSDGRIEDNDGKVVHLLRLLNDDSRKRKEMEVEGDEERYSISQAFLSVLGLTMVKFDLVLGWNIISVFDVWTRVTILRS